MKDSSVGVVPLMEPARGGGELAKSLNIRLLSVSTSIWKNPAICNRITTKHGDTLDRKLTGEEESSLEKCKSLTDEKLVLKSGSGKVIWSGLQAMGNGMIKVPYHDLKLTWPGSDRN